MKNILRFKKCVWLFELCAFITIGLISYLTSSNFITFADNYFMGTMGLLYVFNARNNNKIFPIYGLVFASIYAFKMFNANILGEAYFNAYISIPMLLIGLWQNFTNIKDDGFHVKTRAKLSTYNLITLTMLIWGITILGLYMLNSNSILIDSISTAFAFVGTILLNLRYNKESFIFWTLANLTNFILHLVLGNYMLCVVFAIYLINGIIALIDKEVDDIYAL